MDTSMESETLLVLISSLSLALFALCLTGLSLWLIPKAITQGLRSSAEATRDVRLKEIEALDKAIALIASGDALTFQQLQAMNGVVQYDTDYDPSDEGEIRRIHERLGDLDDTEEQMTDAERRFLGDIFPGGGFAGTSVQ
jgi:hypothetical protein